jgi:dipeptidase E
MRLLLSSGGLRTAERVAAFARELRALFGGAERVLFVPWALADHDGYLRAMRERGLDGGYELQGIHECEDPVAAVREAEAVFVGGGNTFRLTAALQDHGVLEPLRGRVRDGMPYAGASAGTNVACPTMRTTNDMPIVQPESFETLGLVPFQINPHYFEGSTWVRDGERFREHFGETRDQRIAEFHEENEVPVVGLWEGAALRVRDEQIDLIDGPARLFRRGMAPLDLVPPARLDPLLGTLSPGRQPGQ